MAELDIRPAFGREIKDGYKPVNAWVSNGIAWLDDIQQFYRERSAIEKEYSAKLQALAKKYFERKMKKTSSLSVGDSPTATPGSLESASMTTWSVQLTTLESRAAEHERFATELISGLAEPVKHLSIRCEELRKHHGEYAAKLEKERDMTYADLKKTKGKYDSACQEVENRRKKTESSYDFGKQKAHLAFQQQQVEMHNAKNLYLVNINVTNKQKERYYHEYVPELLDSLQDLSESRVSKLNTIWSLAAQIETSTLSRSTELVKHLQSEIPRNNPLLDSMMFVRHNTADWQDPPDFTFEPSPVWLDDNRMIVDEPAKVFLRNILIKSKSELVELRRDADEKRREIARAKDVRKAIREGRDKRDEVEIARMTFAMQDDFHEVEKKKTTAEVEVSTITTAVGDVSFGAKNHNFKSQTFKIPTNCDLCGERIWGLSAKGFDCRDCGFTCHSKCEMKVPPDCPGEQTKEERKKLKAERQEAAHAVQPVLETNTPSTAELPKLTRSDTANSLNTLSSRSAVSGQRSVSGLSRITSGEGAQEPSELLKPSPSKAGGARRVLAPPPTQYAKDVGMSNGNGNIDSHRPGELKGKMMYFYQQNGDGEISVDEGQEVVIVEPDDGSGWMKVRTKRSSGLVPASYVDLSASPSPPTPSNRPASTYSASSVSLVGGATAAGKKKGPAVAPKRGAKKLKYVEAMYDYEARSDAEHSMAEGERLVLINKDSGDGWADVEKGGAVKSVPANYIQEV